ncbi:DUF4328 domain-containing protein [Nocardia sp. NPDC051030]|uniref:DUF4328 domain-containing protein n=1 Tax=Nocardia sp. NPDC051030 TaxID=3155162 RepID=UPI00342D3AA0
MADSRSGRAASAPVVQPCARCGARWAVQGKPLHWCPRCHGVLLSPAPVDAPPERRNYRWVARPPGRRSHPGGAQRRSASRETPRYTQIPRWGLQDRPPAATVAPRNRLRELTARLPRLLMTTGVLFLVAAVAELGRYGILLRNRTRLIQPWLLMISDLAVYIFGIASLLLALASAVALVGWLADTRRDAYARAGKQDPRSLRELALGSLVPGVNLVFPGVFLTEAVRERGGFGGEGDPRLLRVVRIWWGVWVLNGVMVVAAQLYRFADSLQMQADGVMFAVWTDLAAAAVAVLTLWLVRAFDGRDLLGRARSATRWVVATTPADTVIAPVHPGGGATHSESAGRAPDTTVGNDEASATADSGPTPEPEHEEVLAK